MRIFSLAVLALFLIAAPVQAQDNDRLSGSGNSYDMDFSVSDDSQTDPPPPDPEEDTVSPAARAALKKAEDAARQDAEKKRESAIANPIFNALPREIQDEILAEVDHVYDQCNVSYIHNSFTDCECMAIEFLEARLEQPEAFQGDLIQSLMTQCPNVPGIAGFAYGKCLQVKFDEPNLEKYCECHANEVAKRFEQEPVTDFTSYRRYALEAYRACDNARF